VVIWTITVPVDWDEQYFLFLIKQAIVNLRLQSLNYLFLLLIAYTLLTGIGLYPVSVFKHLHKVFEACQSDLGWF